MSLRAHNFCNTIDSVMSISLICSSHLNAGTGMVDKSSWVKVDSEYLLRFSATSESLVVKESSHFSSEPILGFTFCLDLT